MEIGAVKQDFNNEIIQLKKNLNQAKTQTIHKLTRKAKTLTEKKCPETLKEKFKRKAESAVREVLVIKKVKARDIARFIVTHTGKLNDYLNKPTIDNNKACARLLLHKALQEKYKHIRGKFSNVSIDDLFMSRQERLKLKKEEMEKQKNKKKRKEENKKKRLSNAVNVEGEWEVENTDKEPIKKDTVKNDIMYDEEMSQSNDLSEGDDLSEKNNSVLCDESDANDDTETSDHSDEPDESNDESVHIKQNDYDSNDDNDTNNDNDDDDDDDDDNNDDDEREEIEETVDDSKIKKQTVLSKVIKNNSKNEIDSVKPKSDEVFELKMKLNNKSENKIKKADKKVKDVNKNKNLKDKLQKRKLGKEFEDLQAKTKKVLVDQFFVTSTGNNYKSLVEPRNPDEVKDEHKRGNRKYRRAVMFGHVLKTKPKKNSFQSNNNSNNFKKKSGYNTKQFITDNNNVKEDNKNRQFDNRQSNFSSKGFDKRDAVPEKLHPSWEAKKKQSTILPFQGKKIVFDES